MAPEQDMATGTARMPVGFYLGATLVGLWMRLVLAGWRSPIPFDHLLHAHSHTLYFGWAGLLILVAADAPYLRWAGFLVTVMGAAFLAGGYEPAAIVASTLVMFAWYAAIGSWWRRPQRSEDSLLRRSLAYMLLASVGVWVLAVLKATEAGNALAEDLAIHGFLGTFAWSFVFGAAALVARWHPLDPDGGRRLTTWWLVLAWITFPLGVAGGPEVAVLGPMARIAGVLLLYPAALWMVALWRTTELPLRLAAAWFGLAATGLAATGIGGTALLEAAGRAGVVVYLHTLLLGFVTTVAMWHLGRLFQARTGPAIAGHQAGVALMLTGVALPWVGTTPTIAMDLAAWGALLTWLAGLAWAGALWGATPGTTHSNQATTTSRQEA